MVALKEVMDTKLYDLKEAQNHPLWAQELYNPDEHVPETEEYGITSLFTEQEIHLTLKKFMHFLIKSGQVWYAQKVFFGFLQDQIMWAKYLKQVLCETSRDRKMVGSDR